MYFIYKLLIELTIRFIINFNEKVQKINLAEVKYFGTPKKILEKFFKES